MTQAVTINLPHRSTPHLLASVLPLWLNQSVPTLIDVVDNGSSPDEVSEVQRICRRHGDRVRLHLMPTRKWSHLSEPIAIACELSQLYAETDKVLWSHVDVFPRVRDLVAHWSGLCDEQSPVVGYEMSPRDHVGGWIKRNWKGFVGHTLTIGHVPTLRSFNVRWDFLAAGAEFALRSDDLRFWDTEVTFNLCLNRAGITPNLIGHDENYTHKVDCWHGHARSYPSATVHRAAHAATAGPWIEEEMQLAAERLRIWLKESKYDLRKSVD